MGYQLSVVVSDKEEGQEDCQIVSQQNEIIISRDGIEA